MARFRSTTFLILSCTALLTACGPGPTGNDAGTPDSGSDAGVDAGVDAGTDAGTEDAGPPKATLSYIQANIFNQPFPVGCFSSTEMCHDNGHPAIGPAGGLVLSSAAASFMDLVNVPEVYGNGGIETDGGTTMLRVDPGHPENSFLILKLRNTWMMGVTGYGNEMPYTGTQLSEDQINLISQWIAEGAQNN